MPPEEAGRCLALLLPEREADAAIELERLQLWPRDEEAGNIPDLIADGRRNGARFRLILEVKRGGGALRSGQAAEQWRNFRRVGPGWETMHVILADHYLRQKRALDQDDETRAGDPDLAGWAERRSVLLWSELAARAARHAAAGQTPAERWCRHVATALRRVGHVPFDGFSVLWRRRLATICKDYLFFDQRRQFRWPRKGPRFRAPIFWQG
ncbi:hypothetical protein GCM10010964_05970 [Caldovatus sediminis]|uniref:Uncharacterized protein n=1 Tax=Caldovatus sediminis TaxID=2041189 RepID=A0A8J2Z8L4_9PROT|nr:hypothetical protein [Caldovatus sediminis]GGG20566.1 hypothetical protein GCM10010964_05970 [Caldovatus sediminis]